MGCCLQPMRNMKGWPSHSGSKNNYSCFTDEEDWGLLEVQSTAPAPSAPKSSMQVPQDGEDFVGQPWYHGPLSRQVPLPLTGPHTIWWGVSLTFDLLGTPGSQIRALGSRSIRKNGLRAEDCLQLGLCGMALLIFKLSLPLGWCWRRWQELKRVLMTPQTTLWPYLSLCLSLYPRSPVAARVPSPSQFKTPHLHLQLRSHLQESQDLRHLIKSWEAV